jgi:hypothetical protein
MLSSASIFGDDVKREYLSAQNLRLHFLLMIFDPHALIASALRAPTQLQTQAD